MSPKHEARLPLAFIPAGQEVRLAGFGDEIDPLQREQLIAYGLAESRPLTVLQQRPMTVILADEVELALEHAVARHIWVAKIRRVPEYSHASRNPQSRCHSDRHFHEPHLPLQRVSVAGYHSIEAGSAVQVQSKPYTTSAKLRRLK